MANFLIIASHDNDIVGTSPILTYGDKELISANYRYLKDHGYNVEVCKVTAPLTKEALQSLLTDAGSLIGRASVSKTDG